MYKRLPARAGEGRSIYKLGGGAALPWQAPQIFLMPSGGVDGLPQLVQSSRGHPSPGAEPACPSPGQRGARMVVVGPRGNKTATTRPEVEPIRPLLGSQGNSVAATGIERAPTWPLPGPRSAKWPPPSCASKAVARLGSAEWWPPSWGRSQYGHYQAPRAPKWLPPGQRGAKMPGVRPHGVKLAAVRLEGLPKW